MNSVLFVCLGNICRSPIAEGVARKIAGERGLDIIVDSAGTGSWHVGESPCQNSITVASKYGVDISMQRARQVKPKDFERFDLVIALDDSNYNDLKRMGASSLHKLGTFGYNDEDVPDPYFFDGYEGFDKVYEMIEVCVGELFDREFSVH